MHKKALIIAGVGLFGLYLWRRSEWEATIATFDDGEGAGLLDIVANDIATAGYRAVSTVTGGIGNMEISFNGLAHLKEVEGFRLNVYADIAGHSTVGYGHKLTAIDKASGMQSVTREEASEMLAADVATAEAAVNRLVKVGLSQNQFDALVSFVFNVGQANFAESTMLRRLNAGDYSGAGNEFGRWVFVTNPKTKKKVISEPIKNRRVKEYNLFTGKRVLSV